MLTRTVANRVYDYSHAVGGSQMPLPVAAAVGSGDTVYVVSRQYEQIADVPWNKTATFSKVGKFTIGAESGDERLESDIAGYGDGDEQLIWPAGIALDSHENIYVTDEWLNRVSVFDKDGTFLRLWGTAGEADGEFNGPSGIAVDSQDDLYIVDSLNHRVQRCTKNGEFLAGWGERGGREGQFDSPWGMSIDHEGCVYVADHKNHRVQKFTPEGGHMATFGSPGNGPGELSYPSDVAVDPEGDVYVCDWANNRIQVFAADGEFITSFTGDAQRMAMWQQQQVDANADVIKARRRAYTLEPEWRFALPTGVEFDAKKRRLLVADTQRSRLQIYGKLNDYLEPQFNL